MKILFTIAFTLSFLIAANAQEVKNEELYKHYKEVFVRASKYNDVETAKSAILNMMVLSPSNLGLADTLATLYFDQQKYPSTILVSNDILVNKPNYAPILELRALSYEQLGLKARALPDYESLYLQNNNLFTLYKIAAIQGDLGRNNEAFTNLDIIIENPKALEEKLIFVDAENKQQEIPMKAGAYNIKGLIYKASDNKEEAKKSFEAALGVSPEFYLAKKNLEDLNN